MTSSDPKPSPRLKVINREQMLLRAIDVDQWIEPEHRARCIWEFVGRLNLDSFHDDIRSVEGRAGRSALNPHLLISLWIHAYSRGIGSAPARHRGGGLAPAFPCRTPQGPNQKPHP